MNARTKKSIAMGLISGALVLLYNYFPDARGIVIFSAFYGLALNHIYV